MEKNKQCNHKWVSNSGKGGNPNFKFNRQMSNEPLMHIMCSKCNTRTWVTKNQWKHINEN